MKKMTLIVGIIMLLVSGCGNNEKQEDNSQQKETKNSYVDMTEYKGAGGYIIENNIYDYSNFIQNAYVWQEDIKLPFPKPDGVEGAVNNGTYILSGITEDIYNTYLETLRADGFNPKEIDCSTSRKIFIENERYFTTLIWDIESQEMSVYVISGFVKESMISTKKAEEIIDKSGMLKEAEGFEDYYIISVAGESVWNKGYSEYLVLTTKYYENYDNKYKPYYVIIKDEKVVMCEQGIYSPYLPSSANIITQGSRELLIITCGYYEYTATSSTQPHYTGIFVYENGSEGKFKLIGEDRIASVNGVEDEHIGIAEDGEYHIYNLILADNAALSKGRKNMWILNGICDKWSIEKVIK